MMLNASICAIKIQLPHPPTTLRDGECMMRGIVKRRRP